MNLYEVSFPPLSTNKRSGEFIREAKMDSLNFYIGQMNWVLDLFILVEISED